MAWSVGEIKKARHHKIKQCCGTKIPICKIMQMLSACAINYRIGMCLWSWNMKVYFHACEMNRLTFELQAACTIKYFLCILSQFKFKLVQLDSFKLVMLVLIIIKPIFPYLFWSPSLEQALIWPGMPKPIFVYTLLQILRHQWLKKKTCTIKQNLKWHFKMKYSYYLF